MKKSIFKNIVMIAILTLFTQAKMLGQITGPYNIINANTNNCAISVSWELVDCSGNSCATSGGFITIPGSSFITIPAAVITACGACDVIVTLEYVDTGGATLYLEVNAGSTPATSISATDCTTAVYPFIMNWTTASTTIN